MALLATSPDELAFESLLAIRGELVTFRAAKIRALINRTPEAKDLGAVIDVTTREGSILDIPVLSKAPAVGEVVTDRFGFAHRIIKPSHIGHAYHLICEVTR